MSGIQLSAQTKNFVTAVNGSTTSTAAADTAKDIAGSKVFLLPGECEDGMVIRWTLSGTLAGGNAVFTIKVYFDSTLLQTLTSTAATAGDWYGQVVMICGGGVLEKIAGFINLDEEDCTGEYDAGTTSLQNGGILKLVATSGNSGDTVTVGFCITERFVIP